MVSVIFCRWTFKPEGKKTPHFSFHFFFLHNGCDPSIKIRCHQIFSVQRCKTNDLNSISLDILPWFDLFSEFNKRQNCVAEVPPNSEGFLSLTAGTQPAHFLQTRWVHRLPARRCQGAEAMQRLQHDSEPDRATIRSCYWILAPDGPPNEEWSVFLF